LLRPHYCTAIARNGGSLLKESRLSSYYRSSHPHFDFGAL
jgi:hypothetical protein